MKADLYSISKIFTERLLRIPDYQRGYAWTDKQLKEFWNDLDRLPDGKNHYTGVLTLEDVPHSSLTRWDDDQWIINAKSYAPHYVVDGQQRLTTSIILIQAILESVDEDAKINYTSLGDIKKKFIFDSKDEGISRSYIFGYERDNPSYEFLKNRIFGERSAALSTTQETIYTHNLENAKAFFKRNLETLTVQQIEVLYRKLTQHFLFNIYSISEDIDVFVAFETMNNRGKPLSHLELLKNRLIYLSTQLNCEDYERTALRNVINESWGKIYHNLGRNKRKPLDDDLFLQNHFVLYFGEEIAKEGKGRLRHYRSGMYYLNQGVDSYYSRYLLDKLFTSRGIDTTEESTEPIDVKKIHDYVISLRESVELWYYILNPEHSNFEKETQVWLEKLNRLGIFVVAPLVLTFFQNEKESDLRVKFLKALENRLFIEELFTFVRFGHIGYGEYLQFAFELKNGDIDTQKLIRSLEGVNEEYRSQSDLLKNLKREITNSKGFYSWTGLKYFFYEYEQSLREKSKAHESKLDWEKFTMSMEDQETIEHIYPQRPKKSCWTEPFTSFTSPQRNILRHSLGNLVPLSKAKNSSFSNKCFKDKVGNDKDTVGFRYGSYAENELTQYPDWTAHHIVDRGIKLLTFMEERWKIKVGDKKEKISFLKLEFVNKKGK